MNANLGALLAIIYNYFWLLTYLFSKRLIFDTVSTWLRMHVRKGIREVAGPYWYAQLRKVVSRRSYLIKRVQRRDKATNLWAVSKDEAYDCSFYSLCEGAYLQRFCWLQQNKSLYRWGRRKLVSANESANILAIVNFYQNCTQFACTTSY